jgi:hypothetical protein
MNYKQVGYTLWYAVIVAVNLYYGAHWTAWLILTGVYIFAMIFVRKPKEPAPHN